MRKRNYLKKGIALLLSSVMIVGLIPITSLGAGQDVFTSSAYANHWGRSDLRAYLNGVTKTNSTLPIDTATDGTNAEGYASQFSDAE